MKRISLILILLIAVSSVSFAKKKKDKENKQVILFGVTVSLTDSSAFITEIMTVDSLLTNKDGFIDKEEEYSTQLKSFLEKNYNVANHACAIFYDTDIKDINKKYKKINNRLVNKEKRSLKTLPKTEFNFTLYKEDSEEE